MNILDASISHGQDGVLSMTVSHDLVDPTESSHMPAVLTTGGGRLCANHVDPECQNALGPQSVGHSESSKTVLEKSVNPDPRR